MKTVKLFLVILMLASLSFATAQEPARNLRNDNSDLFLRLDANKDKKLSIDEFKKMNEVVMTYRKEQRKTHFDLLDADSDGKITLKEFEAVKHQPKRRGNRTPLDTKELFGKKDVNNDDVITFEEFQNFPQNKDFKPRMTNLERRFNRMDSDNDGFLSLDEFKGKLNSKSGSRDFKRGKRRMRR